MKKLLTNLGGKMAAFADEVASYNDPSRPSAAQKAPGHQKVGNAAGPGSPATSGGAEAELHPVLEHLLRNVRSHHVRQHFVRTPASEYTQRRGVTIQAATFNVGGKKPPAGFRLGDWLGLGSAAGGVKGPRWPKAEPGEAAAAAGNSGGPDGPDMLAIGFEELVPLNAGHVMGMVASGHVDAWDRCVAAYLNGEEWAAQRYSPAASATGAAAANPAVALMDSAWYGGAQTGKAVPAPPSGGASGAGDTGAGGDDGDKYVQVASKQLVGVYLTVWVRSRLLPEVRGVQVTTVSTGFGGYLGNKGAVAARMRLYDSSIVFVAAHLTAGEAEGDELRRNADVNDILRRAVFYGASNGGAGAVPMTAAPAALISASLGPGYWTPGPAGILDHDLVIWVGDLNYRLATAPSGSTATLAGGALAGSTVVPSDVGAAVFAAGAGSGVGSSGAGAGSDRLTDAEVRAAIRSGRLDTLLAADQLNRERAAGRVFRGWHEGRITFMPTYKFKVGTNQYVGQSDDSDAASSASGVPTGPTDGTGGADDRSPDPSVAGSNVAAPDAEKHRRRTPAWCDRVLWWARAPARPLQGSGSAGAVAWPRLEQLAYWRGETLISDHKPVAAAFKADVVSHDRRRVEAVLEAALRHVDQMLASLRPKVTVDPVVLEAGDWVPLGRPVPLRLTLTNTGTTEAMFHFVPPPRQLPTAGQLTGGAGRGRGADAGGGKFGFDDDTPPLPGWLSAQPAEGILQPGAALEMDLTVLVEGGPEGAAGQLAATATSAVPLDTIAILRIEDSGDKFISVGGRYLRSFVGLPLETLATLGRQPALSRQEAEALAGHLGVGPLELSPYSAHEAEAAEAAHAMPKEVWALVSALEADSGAALRTPGIFVDSAQLVLVQSGDADAATSAAGTGKAAASASGSADGEAADESVAAAALQPTRREAQRVLLRQLESLRIHLDAGGSVPPATSPHDVAAMLLLWAGQLPQPLLPPILADAAAVAPPASAADAAALLARHCTPLQLALVAGLLALLRAALEPAATDRNGLTAERLAAAVAAWWFPPLAAGAASGQDAASAQRALLAQLLGACGAGLEGDELTQL